MDELVHFILSVVILRKAIGSMNKERCCFREKLILIKSINTQINPTARQGQNKVVAKRIA